MAVRFDAAADRLLRTTDVLNANGAYTLMFWLYLTSDLNAYECIAYLGDGGTDFNDCDYIGFDNSTGNPRLVLFVDAAGANSEASGSRLSINTWYHIAVVRAGSTSLALYLNGVLDITNTQNIGSRAAITRMELGAATASNFDRFDGRADRIKAWSIAFAQPDIQVEMDQIDPVRLDNVYGWWPGFPGATERLADYGGARDWTAAGALTDEDGSPVAWSVPATPSFAEAAGVIVAPGAVFSQAVTVNPDAVLGALAVAPAAAGADGAVVAPIVVHGSLLITPSALDALAAAVDPAVAFGDLVLVPTAAAAPALVVDPGVVFSQLLITPAAIDALAAAIDPSVVLGALALTPSAVDALGLVANPDVQTGGDIIVAPAAAGAPAQAIDPGVVFGDLLITPAALDALAASADPAVVLGALVLAPAAAEALGLVVDPNVQSGSSAIAPAAATAGAAVIDPAVELGSLIVIPVAVDAAAAVVDPAVQIEATIVPGAVSANAAVGDPDVGIPAVVVVPAPAFAAVMTSGPAVAGNVVALLTLVRRRMTLSVQRRGS